MIVKNKKIYRIVVVLFIFLIFFTPLIYAESYYADVEITVNEVGVVDIEGVSNHPDLLVKNTERYTYKKQSFWILNITKEEVFSDYIYVLNLPYGAKINYINASGFNGIEEESGRLILTGSGNNEKVSIIVQYQVNKTLEELSINTIILGLLLFLIIVLTILLIYFIYQDKIDNTESKKKKASKLEYDLRGLNSRQKDIIRLLDRKKRPLTQTEIQKELNIPKAAVSRNIHSLEIKGLIEIEKIGMSNLIRLKKQ